MASDHTVLVPAELGGLDDLRWLVLTDNQLAGRIPPELGSLGELRELWLEHNELTGSIPLELGGLRELEILWLSHNELTGSIPPELGGLDDLYWLMVGANPLSGPLPLSLARLSLEVFGYADSDLCVPADASFRAWLNTIPVHEGTGVDCTGTTPSDRDILVAFYNATGGPNWTNNTNWLSDEPIGNWHGVTTNSDGGVTEVSLAGNGLVGNLPSELGDLAALGWLFLGDNALTGSIPPELGDLASLYQLSLHGNALTGSIPPELGKLTALEALDLADNSVTGPIPGWLGDLESLTQLVLSRNNLTGSIPRELGDLESLWHLSLNTNNLTGSIPRELGDLESLSTLTLNNNGLTGWIPPELRDLESLRQLWLDNNNLTGSIPPELGDLAALWELYVNGNEDLTGALPLSLAGLSELGRFHYYDTDLCVPDDESFRAWLAALQSHRGTGVDCTGTTPSDRDILVALYNATGGPNWTRRDNWLSDEPIGNWFGVWTNSDGRVTRLLLHGINLTGSIPPELGGLANLESLRLHDNNLTGAIPPELGGLANLERLWLYSNQLTGVIPSELGGLTNLEGLNLNHSNLTGAIPPELGGPANLEWLRLGDNALTGVIPPELGGLANLEYLRLERNNLTGTIPPEIGRVASLRELDVSSNNRLSGPLPLTLEGLPLEQFWYHATDLCVPTEVSFRAWLNAIPNHSGTGVDCTGTTPSDRDILVTFYNATGGSNWTDNTNWLSDGPIGNWYGVRTDSDGRVTSLALSGNNLTGAIPRELGGLANLVRLYVGSNQLAGAIPPELGGLANLELLELQYNQLTGGIPEELANLANLELLYLGDNQLTGGIPAALGGIANLEQLHLNANRLTGGIPEELGNLANLELLDLGGNELTGGIPEELGDLANLVWLVLANNGELTGPLPLSLAGLSELARFHYYATDLCVPAASSFRAWLNTIPNHQGTGVDCGTGAPNLIFSSVSPRTVTVPQGDTVDVEVVIRNDGDADAAATSVRFYQSNDATISTNDQELGSPSSLRGLAASEEVQTDWSIFIPPNFTPQTIYVGWCVDAVPGESNTGDNCSPSVQNHRHCDRKRNAPDQPLGQ